MADYTLDPQDEFPHAPFDTPVFNESVYASAFDTQQKMGGWARLGNRVNEGYAELSVCLYLPDGRIACQFKRPKVTSNDRFSAGGLSMDVLEPFKRFEMRYEGDLMLVDHPDQLRDPAVGLKDVERVQGGFRWLIEADSPIHGGKPVQEDQPTMYGRDFSLNHFNQHIKVSGEITAGEQSWQLEHAHGWRDHSWGPRVWQVINSYRLFTANFGDGHAFMLLRINDKTGRSRRVGVLMVDHEYQEVVDMDVTSQWGGEHRDPQSADVTVRTAKGTAQIHVDIVALAPLRNRRPSESGDEMLISRIWEGFSRFTWDDRVCYGMTEYIERLEPGSLPGDPI